MFNISSIWNHAALPILGGVCSTIVLLILLILIAWRIQKRVARMQNNQIEQRELVEACEKKRALQYNNWLWKC